MRRVLVVYPFLHHYRAAVFAELDASQGCEFLFVSDLYGRDGIRALDPHSVANHQRVVTRRLGRWEWQSGLVGVLARERYDVVIFLGDASSLSTWLGAMLVRIRGCRVLFWTIGWHRPEAGVKRVFRLSFYRLAHTLLLYGNVARRLGVAAGYPEDRMRTVGNSVRPSTAVGGEAVALPEPSKTTWVGAVVRLTPPKHLPLLIEAVAALRQEGHDIGVLLVGNGPAEAELRDAARRSAVPLSLPGAAYGENVLASVYDVLAVTVVPAAVGLTAIQSMAHGTPVVSDDDVYAQMPEWEAIVEGETGELFAAGDAASLSEAILRTLAAVQGDPEGVAARCRAEVAHRWSPEVHARRILEEISAGE